MDALSVAAFEERAASAEARLAMLEQALTGKAASGVDSAGLAELRQLLVQAREEAVKQEDENSKLKYQVMHLKRALEDCDKTITSLKPQ